MSLKRLSEFIEHDLDSDRAPISEANFLSKTFALTQLSRFKSALQKLKSQHSRVKSATSKTKSEQELSDKVDALSSAVEELSELVLLNANLNSHVMNTIVADNLLSANIKRLLDQKRR